MKLSDEFVIETVLSRRTQALFKPWSGDPIYIG
jgi:hypothetical protein